MTRRPHLLFFNPDEWRSDPDELHNRIADPALAGVLAQLKDRLLTFYVETADVVPMRGKGFAEG